ncbi:hypothetical protein J6590_106108 [Homalodisca vitripennis]|nr:hypothetical protein J6590_106108 [Homalodisca vitripennis]
MMDLTKAFDCVGHPQLLECLRCRSGARGSTVAELLPISERAVCAGRVVVHLHEHNTRDRVNLRQTPHQTVWAASLPHNVGARCFWRLPEPLKCIQSKEEFKEN